MHFLWNHGEIDAFSSKYSLRRRQMQEADFLEKSSFKWFRTKQKGYYFTSLILRVGKIHVYVCLVVLFVFLGVWKWLLLALNTAEWKASDERTMHVNNDPFKFVWIKCLALNDYSHLICKLSRLLTKQNRFPHFTDEFLHAHFDGENRKICVINTHLPCFVKKYI